QPVKKEYIEESNVIQAKLCVGLDCDFVCKGEEYAKLLVANDIFGSGSTSRLFMEAREGESLCYYISSRIFRFSSLIGIEAGIDEKNKDKVIEIINNALYSMKNESPTNEEINLSKINIISSYKSLFDKPEGLMNFWLNQIMANDNRNINEVINCIENINDIKGAFDNFKVASFYMLRGGL
ncbi:MAG: insulinase family protein, partial [Lachnospirales bacterium]